MYPVTWPRPRGGAFLVHLVDLTKEERDRHIRRYAELLEIKQKEAKVAQNEPVYSEHGGRDGADGDVPLDVEKLR